MSVPATNVFGPAVSAADIEDAAVATLQRWIHTYLAEFERRTNRSLGEIARPKSWQVYADFNTIPVNQLPLVYVLSPGLAEAPQRDGGGLYSAWWRLGIGLLIAGPDKPTARRIADLYAEAVRLLTIQKASLGGLTDGFRWVDEAYTDVDAEYPGWAALLNFDFHVTGVAGWPAGPPDPIDQPPPLGIVEEVDIDADATREGSGQDPDLMHLVKRRAP